MSSLANIKRVSFSNEMVMDIIELYQYKGKDFYYNNTLKNDNESIIRQTIINDVINMLNLLEIKVSPNRLKLILLKDSAPKNKDEMLVRNLKKIFEICCESVKNFELKANQILSTAQLLFKDIKKITFDSVDKIVQNGLLKEKKRVSKREEITELLDRYEKLLYSKEYETVGLVTNFYIDFINMKPLEEDNEIMGILLIYILLFKDDFTIFKYNSFFELVYKEKEMFRQFVLQANYNWKEGFSHTEPLTQFIIKKLVLGYQTLEKFIRAYEYDAKRNKSDNIENTISKLPQTFSKDDIRDRHPYVSDSTINRTLQRLKDDGLLRPLGVGRSARWIRVKNDAELFNLHGQLDIFAFENIE